MNKKIETLNEYKINDSTNTQVKIYHELIDSIIKLAEHSTAREYSRCDKSSVGTLQE